MKWKKKGGFLSILLGTLVASSLRNIFTGKGTITKSQGRGKYRPGKGKGKGVNRAGEGVLRAANGSCSPSALHNNKMDF